MRIKRLEVIGFKSFCDKTVVSFNDPITGVVGPNGCGKSNIVDAIRWCMGEQSAKHLRGKAMEDVIFAGSENRGPAPMAEVSLTFDDVGFSREKLETALQSDEATVERVLAEVAPTGPEAGEAGDAGEAAEASDADDGAEAPVEVEAVEAAAPEDVAAEAVVGPDGEVAPSVSDEVREMLADRPPALDFAS